MKSNKLALTVAFLVVAAPFVLAQGTYTQIDYPGAVGTFAQSINSAGDILGSYLDSGFNTHGFLLSNGVYTSIDYPGAQDTYPLSINDNGQIVGWFRPALEGFLYDVQTQTFSTLDDTDEVETLPCCINNAGLIAGTVSNSTGQAFGFELKGSTYKLVTPPGSITTSGVALTAVGAFILDGSTSSNPNQYYLLDHGSYSLIHLPKEQNIFIFGVNPQGSAYVGAYQTNPNGSFGYVLENNSRFITLQFPGMSITNAEGINQSGEVAGLFTDSKNVTHGFIWTPPSPARR